MTNKNKFICLHIDDLTTLTLKNDFMTFITQLTYAKQVMFKTTNKQNIFNENGRVVTNAAYSFNVTFGVISKCDFSSTFGLKLHEEIFVTSHMS